MPLRDKSSGHPRSTPPPSPKHPGDDAMPPYTPGGVPEPAGDGRPPAHDDDAGHRPDNELPPKRAP